LNPSDPCAKGERTKFSRPIKGRHKRSSRQLDRIAKRSARSHRTQKESASEGQSDTQGRSLQVKHGAPQRSSEQRTSEHKDLVWLEGTVESFEPARGTLSRTTRNNEGKSTNEYRRAADGNHCRSPWSEWCDNKAIPL